ncbi:MAG: precorrin-3B C(17)-methyltransferase, partial [Rhodobacteraceae bacterium]|nr:precorrin-3B C(17)-methyltransferase [Paracoccaceae bacterium]
RAVSTPEESLLTVALSDATPDMADMRTMVLVGSRQTRLIPRENAAPIVYTPRSMR